MYKRFIYFYTFLKVTKNDEKVKNNDDKNMLQ